MKVTAGNHEEVSDRNIIPTVSFSSAEVEKFSKLLATDVVQITVENEEGLFGRFMVRIMIEHGRPKIIVDAYKKSKTHRVTTISAVADWNL